MFSKIIDRWIIPSFLRSFSSKSSDQGGSIPSSLRFHLDTKLVYGPQRAVRSKRATTPSEFDLSPVGTRKSLFEQDTELLYGSSEGFHRAGSLPKGIPISEHSRYLRQLYRIPRGQPASRYPQAYIPNKYLGIRKKTSK